MLYKESNEQILLFQWLEIQGINNIFAIPNGGSRNILEAKSLKKQGVKAGVPDIFLAEMRNGYGGLFIELKIGKNKLTNKQKEWLDILNNSGYKCVVCYGFDEAKNVILNYLNNLI